MGEVTHPARIAFVGTLYHQLLDEAEDPTSVEIQFSRPTLSREQTYFRKFRATETTRTLDIGWLTEDAYPVGMIIISNLEGRSLQEIPTAEQLAEIQSRVVHLQPKDSVATMTVRPGESLPFSLSNPAEWYIWCAHGTAQCTIHVFPG